MIKQGSEDPITLLFDEDMENIKSFMAALVINDRIVKEYTLEDIKINGNEIQLPLSQEETMRFAPGDMIIEAQWRGADGEKYMADPEKIYVAPRYIRKVLE